MKITKDEATILAGAINIAKYEWKPFSSEENKDLFKTLTALEERLEIHGKDKRRQGRTSVNYWSDILKRYVKQARFKNSI